MHNTQKTIYQLKNNIHTHTKQDSKHSASRDKDRETKTSKTKQTSTTQISEQKTTKRR
jgi:hypothetical protein